MTKHGPKRQLKRLAAPIVFPVPKKVGGRFVIKPRPGPHPANMSIPLGIIIRDVLGYARTLREIKKVLNKRVVKVDGRIITDYRFPVGMMDVIEIVETAEYYRVLPYKRRLVLHAITPEEAKIKIVRIIGKRYVKGGNIQLNLEDGRNILFKVSNDEERKEILKKYNVRDSLIITLPEQKIVGHIKFEEGMYGIITAGRHMGEHGVVKEIRKIISMGARASTVKIETPMGEEYLTALEYILPIGKGSPEITLPSEEEVEKIMRKRWPMPA